LTLLAGILEGVVMVVNDGHTVGASDGLSGLPVVNWSRDHGDPRHLGAEIGFFSVLHSCNQHLQFHPHIHCVVAAGGPARDHSSWISARRSSFLPIGILSRVFRGKFVAGLRHAFHQGRLQFHGSLPSLSHPHAFSAWLRVLFRHHWVVYSKPRPSADRSMCCDI
jgi:Putative transposase